MATLTLDTRQRSLLDPAGEAAPRAAPVRGAAVAAAPVRQAPVAAAPVSEVPSREAAVRQAPREPSGVVADGATLDELVARTWSALLVARAAPCILCGGEVVPRYGSGPHPVGGACRSCGTEIS